MANSKKTVKHVVSKELLNGEAQVLNNTPSPAPTPVSTGTITVAPESPKYFLIEEKDINILLDTIANKLVWSVANPLIMFIKENVKEINTSASRPGSPTN